MRYHAICSVCVGVSAAAAAAGKIRSPELSMLPHYRPTKLYSLFTEGRCVVMLSFVGLARAW